VNSWKRGRPSLTAQKHLSTVKLLIVDELGYVPFTAVGSELLFEAFSQRYERGTTLVTSNLPFDEWTSIFGSERLTGAFSTRLVLRTVGFSGRSEGPALIVRCRRRSRLGPRATPVESP
jgi:DNA replication protein DnaC